MQMRMIVNAMYHKSLAPARRAVAAVPPTGQRLLMGDRKLHSTRWNRTFTLSSTTSFHSLSPMPK
jgi:hypothetical protein